MSKEMNELRRNILNFILGFLREFKAEDVKKFWKETYPDSKLKTKKSIINSIEQKLEDVRKSS